LRLIPFVLFGRRAGRRSRKRLHPRVWPDALCVILVFIFASYDPEKFVEQELPVLIVGTKLDQLGSHRSPPSLRGENMLGANSISVVRRYYHTLNILIHIDAYML
jgi:hypothetical protein